MPSVLRETRMRRGVSAGAASYSVPLNEVNADLPSCTAQRNARPRGGAAGRCSPVVGSANVRHADGDTLYVAETAAGPHGPLLAEADVNAEAEGELHPVVVGAEDRHDVGRRVGREGGRRPLRLEATTQRDADRHGVRVVPFPEIGPEAYGQRAVEREAFTVVQHPGAEVAADQDPGIVPVDLREAGPQTEVVLLFPVAVEALQGIVHPFARIENEAPNSCCSNGR